MRPHPVIYQIFVDTFARGSSGRSAGRGSGGDLEGVVERLDYIAGLGADAIWLTPIFVATSYHGYNVTDYFHVDARLAPEGPVGTADDLFRRLVVEAHDRGLGVLLDLPLNHVGHAYDLDALGLERPPRIRAPRTRQERGWVRDLKYFDHDDSATRRFLFDVARYWVERFGIDGYRYDYVHGIANPFWEALYRELKELRADLFVVGEHWDNFGSTEENAADIAARFDGESGRCFDTLFDFPFQGALVDTVSRGEADGLAWTMDLCDRSYPRPACAMLDNHDMARVADWAGGDPARVTPTLKLLASRTGPISLLYGTEIALHAGQEPRKNIDESSRIPMDWSRLDDPLIETCRDAFGARRDNPVLAHGETVARSGSRGLFVELKRDDADRRALVVLNFSGEACPAGTRLPEFVPSTVTLDPACGGDRLAIHDGTLAAPIPRFGGGLYPLA